MEIYFIFGAFLLIILSFYLIYRLTLSEKFIRIRKKYGVDGDRFIIDGDNIKFKMNHSIACLWIYDCQCDDLWDNLKENDRYYIEYYGINAPLIGSYYYVIKILNQ